MQKRATQLESGSNARVSINTCNFPAYFKKDANDQEQKSEEKLNESSKVESLIKITQSTTTIFVNSLTASIEEVRVYAMDGKCIFTKNNILDSNLSIETADFASGIYSVIVKNQDKKIFTKLIYKL